MGRGDMAGLRQTLRRIDGRGYKAYKDIAGAYDAGGWTLYIDHVQGDPFAAPSKARIRAPQSDASLPRDLWETKVRRIALEDYLARSIRRAIQEVEKPGRGSGKSGRIFVDAGGQSVLERTAVHLTEDWVEGRIEVGLPAAGRRVLGREAETLLCDDLADVVERALVWRSLDLDLIREFVDEVENHEHIRAQLADRGLVAFVANGSVLPRESGASDKPLRGPGVVAFQSPPELEVSLEIPNPIPGDDGAGIEVVAGLGVPRGVTLIAGGGYHGKSTLLDALEAGVYPKITDDGRGYVVTGAAAMKIRAEDGRRVEQVDISPFISRLPQGRSTTAFSSEDASGSTSQAANIVEAIEAGATVLLLDEDTSATNFMVRDSRMQALVHKEHEPITPFIDRVRELYDDYGVSTVLVMGGCGDYFDVADHVIMMREYRPGDVTAEAKAIAREQPSGRAPEGVEPIRRARRRIPKASSLDPSRGKRDVKIDARGVDAIAFGNETVDLRCVEQLVDVSQTRAVGYAMHLAAERFMDGTRTLPEVVAAVMDILDREGLDILDPFRRGDRHPGAFAMPRALELAAALNRLRSLRVTIAEQD